MPRRRVLGVQDRPQAQGVGALALALLAGCGDRREATPSPAPPRRPPRDAPAPPDAAPPQPPLAARDNCAVTGAELVYVVNRGSELLRFDPRKLPADPFERVAALTCDRNSHPYSMAVDRRGIAWVLYGSGELFRVSILDGRCESAGLPEATPAEHFGMAFVSDGPGRTTEKLYVASATAEPVLAELDVQQRPPRWDALARIVPGAARNPELTGTADGTLYAYYPGVRGGFVQALGRDGTLRGPRRALAAPGEQVDAYAFAHWGGSFYVFTTIDETSRVHAIHGTTGKVRVVQDRLPYEIVGAGVSTCAPMLEQVP